MTASSARWARSDIAARSPRAPSSTYQFTVDVPRRRQARQRDLRRQPLQGRQHHRSTTTGSWSASNDPVARDHRDSSPRAGPSGRPRAHVRSAAAHASRRWRSRSSPACWATSATCWSAARWSRPSTAARSSSMRSCPSRSCARATSSPTSRPVARSRSRTGSSRSSTRRSCKAARCSAPRATTSPDPDMRAFTLDKPTQARYSFAVPYLGWVFVALGTPQLRLYPLGGAGAADRAGHGRATVARRRQARRRARAARRRRRARGGMRCAGPGQPSRR